MMSSITSYLSFPYSSDIKTTNFVFKRGHSNILASWKQITRGYSHASNLLKHHGEIESILSRADDNNPRCTESAC